MKTENIKETLSADRTKHGLCGLFGIGFLALALPAAAEPMTFWTGIVLGDYMYPSHELHHFVLGAVFSILLLGVIVQAIRPANRIGALHSSIIIWSSLTVVFTIGGEFSPIHLVLLGLLLGMAGTHPAGASQVPSRNTLDRRMATLAAVTAVGALAFASVELMAHFGAGDSHVEFGHYLFMATAGVSIAGLTLYGSFRGIGWRFPAYASVFLMAVIGFVSVVYPGAEQGSSLGVVIGIVVVVWAVTFVVVAERRRFLGDSTVEKSSV